MSIQPDHRPVAPGNDIDNKFVDPDQQIEKSRPNNDDQTDYDAVYASKEFDIARHEALVQGEQKYNKLGWKKLTICLIVKAIALGALSMPSAFANLGMVAGILLTVGIGFIAIYTSYVVGQVAVKYPHVKHYADAVRLIWGRFGYELCGFMFCCYLSLLVGSHALTGTISFIRIVDTYSLCAVVWGVISAIILFLLALPPSFSEFAILGYIDFGSIIAAIGITIIATGIRNDHGASDWSAWPPEDMTLKSAFLSTTNIVLAYSFAVSQFSFMAEMHRPKDYVKSIWALGLMEIAIYTITGATIYAFVGKSVESPALLSAGFTVSRVAFGVALPVTFISGSISATVVGRYVLGRAFPDSPIKYVNTKAGWMVWIAVIAVITLVAFIIAEAIPFFNTFLGLISSLFISGFTFYFPSLFWFLLIKEGKWNASWHNIGLSIANLIIGIIGLLILGLGTWASIQDILDQYASGVLSGPFTCDSSAYA
ncbi:hypothetical protein Q7P37_000388 [Cladosporium fusiforme]